jgi:putative Mn2+ efflux pump MntP
MEFVTVFFIAIGLSFDTFAVSVSCGLLQPRIRFLNAFTVAFPMAFFQGGMPVIGWLVGRSFSHLLSNVDHWVAFILLFLIGGKMIIDSRKKEENIPQMDRFGWKFILGISLATSIDALVVGFTLGLIDMNILLSALIIGTVTFLVAMLGILMGKKAVGLWGKKITIAGGLILILIGAKIFIEHQFLT